MTTRTLPDSVKLVRDYLAGKAEVTTYTSSRIYDLVPRKPQFPAIMVRRAGGIPQWYGDDRARIDIHCYGRTDEEAKALARITFKTLMEALETQLVHAEGVLTDVKPDSDFQEAGDTTYRPPQPRYIFTVRVTTHS